MRVVLNSALAGLALLSGCARTRHISGSPTSIQAPSKSLYERLGGIDVLRRLVDAWLLEVASDPEIREFFVGVDIARLKLRLVERLCVLAGGPCLYQGSELGPEHAGRGIQSRHMSAFLGDLVPAMRRLKLSGQSSEELRLKLRALGSRIKANGGSGPSESVESAGSAAERASEMPSAGGKQP